MAVGDTVVLSDTELLDWLESESVVLCNDMGEWFCSTREDPSVWYDYPSATTVRGAIKTAICWDKGGTYV